MATARPTVYLAGTKHRRESLSSSSAISRKNKLQRCSVCGALGHKSRTCDLASSKKEEALDGGSSSDHSSASLVDAMPDYQDPRTVLAAYGLLTLSAPRPSCPAHHPPPMALMNHDRLPFPWSASHLQSMSSMSPASPRLLMT